MRELKYAILGLVKSQPLTGYDITKSFNDSLSKFWDARHSQIYPELKRLVDEGMLEFKVTIQGERLEKKLYTITERGKEEFANWLGTDEELAATPKDAFRMRLYFGENLTKPELVDLYKGQLEKLKQRISTLEKRIEEIGRVPALKTDDFPEYLLIMGGIYRDRASIEWLKFCIEATDCTELIDVEDY